jgi:hypothetical protein
MAERSLVRDARRFPIWWRAWFWLLALVNLIGPLFFIGRLEAQLTLAAYAVAGVVIVPLHRRLGWVRLLSVGHVAWLGLVPWLVSRYLETAPSGTFRAWLLAVIVVDGVCLVIDVVEITRYWRGEREPVVWRYGNPTVGNGTQG